MSSTSASTHEFTGCPECGAPAEITERFVLESTDGPIEHATVRCALRHRFTVLVAALHSRRPPAPIGEEPGRWTPSARPN